VTGTAQQAVQTVGQQTAGAPIAAGLVAFGAGMIISALMPASDKEVQVAQRLTEAAQDSGVVEEARSVGKHVGEQLKEQATEAVQEVRSTAQDAAQTVAQEGQSAAQSVKEDAPGTS
jgi:F0F1-type ATP synthase membrane subunit b/b'